MIVYPGAESGSPQTSLTPIAHTAEIVQRTKPRSRPTKWVSSLLLLPIRRPKLLLPNPPTEPTLPQTATPALTAGRRATTFLPVWSEIT